jgi:hypothetical protein
LKPNNVGAAHATQCRWTLEEDKMLTSAVKTTYKKKHGANYRDWAAVSALVPGRTKLQCKNRWYSVLDSKSDATIALVGRWTTDEDSTLKDAVEKHSGNNWIAIVALVPGQTKQQCLNRWHSALARKSDETTARVVKWTKEEDGKLKDAVEKHNGKNREEISALVPGGRKEQCMRRWHNSLGSKSDETTAHVGKLTKEEDSALKDAAEKHNGKDWAAISSLVLGRTKIQCQARWQYILDNKKNETTARTGKMDKKKYSMLADALEQ